MDNVESTIQNKADPSFNVREMFESITKRQDDLREAETKRVDDKIESVDNKVQSQFTSAKEAVGIASTAQEKAMAAALDGTKDALDKADTNNDKRFDAISQKIDTVIEQINKSSGSTGLYVTHSDLAVVVDKIQTSFKTSMESFETSLKPIFAFMNSAQGRSGGLNSSWLYLLGFGSLIGMILGIIGFFR